VVEDVPLGVEEVGFSCNKDSPNDLNSASWSASEDIMRLGSSFFVSIVLGSRVVVMVLELPNFRRWDVLSLCAKLATVDDDMRSDDV